MYNFKYLKDLKNLRKRTYKSPVGLLILVESNEEIVLCHWLDKVPAWVVEIPEGSGNILKKAQQQLDEYFNGDRSIFEISVNPRGSDYQKRVWGLLQQIPYGLTWHYQKMSQVLASSPRAVGTANSRNPISIIIPCHRVIAKSGEISGFAGGIENKEYLLKHEGAK